MGIQLNCDRCGRLIKTVSIKAMNALTENDGICKSCKEAEVDQQKMKEKFKNRLINDATKFTAKWQKYYDELLQEAVAKRLKGEGQ